MDEFIITPIDLLKKMRNEGFNYGEIYLYSTIKSLSKVQDCFASNIWLSNELQSDIRNIQNWLKRLEEKKYITRYYDGDKRKLHPNLT